MRPIITLTTDFGLDDPFVGIMKGVILKIAPEARLIDITHNIEPQNIAQAALVLESSYSYFPQGTVHMLVVDPGVGGNRRPLAVNSRGHYFVAPDNGILSPVLDKEAQCFELTEKKFFLESISNTFHGRDVFAPSAAWIAQGKDLSDLGGKISDPQTLDVPQPIIEGKTIRGQIIYIDRFGNLTTNIGVDLLQKHLGPNQKPVVHIGGKKITGLCASYSENSENSENSEAPEGQASALVNSWNRLEIFIREDNAAEKLRLRVGDAVSVDADESKP